ncbi:MAG: XrtA-associated ATPase [Geobacteraceae bacterium]|nr:XrtA-associated ATPase [Geobacteraceae bacterium]
MYEAYFGLSIKPFELVPNPEFLYLSHSHKKAINYLAYGLQEHTGFILLAGEVGSGKTTIIRNLIKNLDKEVVLARVFNTRADATQILSMINEDFGLDVENKNKVALLRELYDYLMLLYGEGKRAVIIIDEAQNLTADVLEEIRLLSNLEADSVKLVQIILVGQPELLEVITQPELRQLRQRIGVHCQLSPLSRDETEAYVYHRLETAGNRDALIWHEGAFDLLYRYSGGIPRLINQFCDFALLCVFAEESRELTLEMLQEVIGDIAWDCASASGKPMQGASVSSQGIDESHHSIDEWLKMLNAVWGESGSVVRRMEARDEHFQQAQLESMRRTEELLEKISERLGSMLSATRKDSRHG